MYSIAAHRIERGERAIFHFGEGFNVYRYCIGSNRAQAKASTKNDTVLVVCQDYAITPTYFCSNSMHSPNVEIHQALEGDQRHEASLTVLYLSIPP
jgi:hypothetical protein